MCADNGSVSLLIPSNDHQEKALKQKEKMLTKTGKKRKERDPDAPKRARTAFNFFLDAFREEYKRDHPDAKGVVGVTKAGSERWKSMSEEEKLPFEERVRGSAVSSDTLINPSSLLCLSAIMPKVSNPLCFSFFFYFPWTGVRCSRNISESKGRIRSSRWYRQIQAH